MEIFLKVLAGVPLTLLITVGAMAVGTILALPLTLGLRTRAWPVRALCRGVVDLVRGVPQLAWLFLIYYGVTLGDLRVAALPAGILALGIVAAGYLAEIFRGSLKGVASGQWEAAQALGLDSYTVWSRIIGPQLFRIALPGYTNYSIALLKDSAVVSVVGVAEMAFRSGQLARSTDAGIYVFLFAATIYIVLSVPLGILSRSFDTRLRAAVAR